MLGWYWKAAGRGLNWNELPPNGGLAGHCQDDNTASIDAYRKVRARDELAQGLGAAVRGYILRLGSVGGGDTWAK
jgi:hypothetical protein